MDIEGCDFNKKVLESMGLPIDGCIGVTINTPNHSLPTVTVEYVIPRSANLGGTGYNIEHAGTQTETGDKPAAS